MIEIYKDRNLAVLFSQNPQIFVDYPKNKYQNCKKPFLLQNDLEVVLIDYTKEQTYYFVVKKNYCWDGATIPRFFWRLVGSKTDPRFLVPSLVHDVLCENHHYVNHDRYFADCVFERLLYISGVNPFIRWMMFHSVDNYQKFCAWEKK